jgi:hypothetical protein
MTQLSFSRLWGSAEQSATETSSPFSSDAEAKRARDIMYNLCKALDVKARRWTLAGQTRQYWSWGVPCGDVCNCYKLDIDD